jgi:parallel beta-helix repeat protein
LTWDSGRYSVYVDGEEMASGTYTGLTTLNYVMDIGNDGNPVSQNTEAFAGLLDEVRLYDHALSADEVGTAMNSASSPQAWGPSPKDGGSHPETWVTLSWIPGDSAVSHDVYLGDSFEDVASETGEAFRGNQTTTSFLVGLPGYPYPDGLVPGTTYYWRVDEFDGAVTHKGDVWNFTTPESLVSNPVLWLDASDIDGDGDTNDNPADGGDVTIWADKSGNGNDAAGSTVPSYSTSAINGKAAVHFQPNEYLVGQNGFEPNITATVFIVGVLHSKAEDSSVVIFSTQPNGGTDSARRGLCVSVAKESTVIKTDRGMTFPDNPVGLANPYLVVDVDTGNVDSNAFNIARFIDGGSNDLNGDIAEIIVYDCELTTAEKNEVACYLAQKYGLGSVNIPDRPTMTPRGLGGLEEQNGCFAENCWCDGADLDYSGNVDFVDFEILAQSYSRPENAYYVATDGRDSNPGTEQLPWRSVQRAANTLTAGETVYIKQGTYNERIWVQNSGTPGNFITFAAYPGHTVTIDGTGIPFDWYGLFNVKDKSYIKVSGLRVINSSYWGIYVGGNSNNIIIDKNYTYNTASSGIAAWRGPETVNCSDIIISGNEIELAVNGKQQECISLSGIDRFEVRYNYVHHGSLTQTLEHSTGGEGIDTKDGCSNGKVYGNCVYRTYNKLGIYVDAWDEDSSNIEVFDNIVHDCQMGFAVASEAGGELENIVFYNNLAYNNDTWGIRVNAWHDDSVLKHGKVINNTFYNNLAGIYIGDEIFEDLVVRNNICSQNEQAQLINTSETKHRNQQDEIYVDHNLIDGFRGWWCEIYGSMPTVGDPCFVNPSLGDFHLKPNSPAIDKGLPIDAPSYDFEGDPRPAGSGYDIGIDEYCK